MDDRAGEPECSPKEVLPVGNVVRFKGKQTAVDELYDEMQRVVKEAKERGANSFMFVASTPEGSLYSLQWTNECTNINLSMIAVGADILKAALLETIQSDGEVVE